MPPCRISQQRQQNVNDQWSHASLKVQCKSYIQKQQSRWCNEDVMAGCINIHRVHYTTITIYAFVAILSPFPKQLRKYSKSRMSKMPHKTVPKQNVNKFKVSHRWSSKTSRVTTSYHMLHLNAENNKKLSYRRVNVRCILSVIILPITTQQCRNYLYDKSWPNRWYEVGGLDGGNVS